MKKYYIYFAFGVLIAAAYVVVSAVSAAQIFTRTADHIDISADFINKDNQAVEFESSDGLIIRGWLFDSGTDQVVVFVPGILDNRTSQGYYGSHLAMEILDKGFSVMMFDPRARGESEGSTRLKGEKNDVIAVVEYLKTEGFEEKDITILSYSTGTLSTLKALSEVNVGKVVFDSSPLNFEKTIASILEKEQPIIRFFTPGVLVFSRIFYGEDLDASAYIEKVKNKDTRFLVMHTLNDVSVDVSNSKTLASGLSNSKLIVYPNGSHIESYKKNKEQYLKDIFAFISATDESP